MTMQETHFEHCDDHAIVVFYEFTCSNLNDYERTRTGKGQQTKTAKFEHYDDRMFFVSARTKASFLLLPPLPPHLIAQLLNPCLQTYHARKITVICLGSLNNELVKLINKNCTWLFPWIQCVRRKS